MRGATMLGIVAAITVAGVAYVHRAQTLERQEMHSGVLRDQARLEAKLREQEAGGGAGGGSR